MSCAAGGWVGAGFGTGAGNGGVSTVHSAVPLGVPRPVQGSMPVAAR